MIQDTEHEPRLPGAGRPDLGLWVAFLAGPTLWFAHFIAVYLLGEVLCTAVQIDTQVLGLPLLSFATLVATAVAAGAIVLFTVAAHRRSRRADDSTLPRVGVLLGVLFFVAVLFTGLPALVLPPC